MARVLLWIFVVISLIAWLIGKESFFIFYALLTLLMMTEAIRNITVTYKESKSDENEKV